MHIDTAAWSGDGAFTARVVDVLSAMPAIAFLRVEDAPASRAESGYNFISTEIFVRFEDVERAERRRWLGVLPITRRTRVPAMTLAELEAGLAAAEVGEADYGDDGLLQYLRTERIVSPYQTKGVKLIELVRIYDTGTHDPRRAPAATAAPR